MLRLVMDTETTGLSPRFNKTLTVGMLLVDVEKDFLKIIAENHIFVKHDAYNSNRSALKVNGINLVEHDKIAVKPKIACSQINSFVDKHDLRDTLLVGHNFHFDRGFLGALFDQGNSISKLNTEHEDTMRIWRNLKKEGNIPFDLRSNLGTIADYFDIDYTKAHDALADCHITAKVYHKLIKV
ncbi:3'-5' exonuclease [Candidatus Pacearchaeota archaeon]|nr:3'-5' exonuclease [Candidatus Pacearchaeota archaeon]